MRQIGPHQRWVNDLLPDEWEGGFDCLGGTGSDRYDDVDSDGLDNLEEFLSGKDPCAPNNDADTDGLLDNWEVIYFGTTGYGPNDDPDGDSLNNATELLWGIHPGRSAADRDRDTLPDTWEIRWFGDLDKNSNGDANGDGFTNLEAYEFGLSPVVGADFDADGNVSRDDYARFQQCLMGPGFVCYPNLPAACVLPYSQAGIIAADFDADCDVDLTDFAEFQKSFTGPSGYRHLLGKVPDHEESLWRTEHNIVRLTFNRAVTAPTEGEILIQQLLDEGAFGEDLWANFTLTVEDDAGGHPRVLRIAETKPSLTHGTWIAVQNAGGWAGVVPFEVQYVVMIGDCNEDKKVLATDLSCIFPCIPTANAPDQSRCDINGDGKVLATDLSTIFPRIPSPTPPTPSGH